MLTPYDFADALRGDATDNDGLPGTADECGPAATLPDGSATFVAYGWNGERFRVTIAAAPDAPPPPTYRVLPLVQGRYRVTTHGGEAFVREQGAVLLLEGWSGLIDGPAVVAAVAAYRAREASAPAPDAR